MTDRYVYASTNGRSSTFNNPERASMPSSIGYSSLHAGDMHVMPASTRQQPITTPRGYTVASTTTAAPTNNRTYAYEDPRAQEAVGYETIRNRRSTIDSNVRPPVIITTTQKDRPHGSSSTATNVPTSSHAQNRGSSPVRSSLRVSETQFSYAQPASSIRNRSDSVPYPRNPGDVDDYSRPRDRSDSLANRDAEAYRNSRPSVLYSAPHHSTSTINYGDEYQYTNAGELVRYDLDHSTTPARSRSKRESFDRGYYRPNVSYNADQRSFNINTSSDQSRNYGMNTSRPYEGRGGPPMTTRGFDKIERSYDAPRERDHHTPVAALPPTPTRGDVPVGTERRGGRRLPRPVSLYQDGTPSSSHFEDFHRSRDDERIMREARERELERPREIGYFHDDNVTSRGFGIRTAPADDHRDHRRDTRNNEPQKRSNEEVPSREPGVRRESRHRDHRDVRREEPQIRSNEELSSREPDFGRDSRRRSRIEDREDLPPPESDLSRDSRRRSRVEDKEDRREQREDKRGRDDKRGSDDDKERPRDKSRLRDKLASGVGIAAAAVGLAPILKDDSKNDKEPRRRRSPTDDRDVQGEPSNVEKRSKTEKDRSREQSKDRTRGRERRESPKNDSAPKDRPPRNTDIKPNGEVSNSLSDSGDAKKDTRRHRTSAAFNPNDAGEIHKLREQLAAMKTSDSSEKSEKPEKAKSSDKGKEVEREPAIVTESKSKPSRSRSRSRSMSEARDAKLKELIEEDSRGRASGMSAINALAEQGKSVRVVSPPREKPEEKPLKGILKQPSARFPEQTNFIREGAAPHKEDKKLKDAPAGARWTKISRKIVNPEALTVGKERFEVRDDFVIVLRVLNKEEIQAYASATQVLRDRRRNARERDREGNDDDSSDDTRRGNRSHRRGDDESSDETEDRDRERRRRHHRRRED
ncbi:unnamed protein product [Clonostachys rhizophaga]|uniref:DUF8035 domain-containing protein n=1 Tax=Clonostachys rhizophaga TaxID=160324 RepID=A0A9N9YC13_9HYPO|nr:unnamed protein product [Clonostachys rhizophaga]